MKDNESQQITSVKGNATTSGGEQTSKLDGRCRTLGDSIVNDTLLQEGREKVNTKPTLTIPSHQKVVTVEDPLTC